MKSSARSRKVSTSRPVRATSDIRLLGYGPVRELKVTTERHTQLVDITPQVREATNGADGAAVLVYVPHTTAGLTINEHADPMVARDFEMALERIVPEGWGDRVLVFVGVEDVESTLARAEELGARSVQPAQSVPGVVFGVLEDAQGHRIGVAAN